MGKIISETGFLVLRRVRQIELNGIKQDAGWHFGQLEESCGKWEAGEILLVGPDERGGKHLLEIGDGYITCRISEIRGRYEQPRN